MKIKKAQFFGTFAFLLREQFIGSVIPKIEPWKTKLWKTLDKVGEILLMTLAILALIAFLFSYIALCFISPAG